MITEVGVVAVMNPIGGDFGYAGVGVSGMLSGFDDSMNSEGLYAEFNNVAGSIGPTMYSDRINTMTWTADLLFEYSTQEEIVLNLNSTRLGGFPTFPRRQGGTLDIVCRDNPERDCIASATALVRIAGTSGVENVRLLSGGRVSHQQNRETVR